MSRTIGLRKYKRHLPDNDIYDIKINDDNNYYYLYDDLIHHIFS